MAPAPDVARGGRARRSGRSGRGDPRDAQRWHDARVGANASAARERSQPDLGAHTSRHRPRNAREGRVVAVRGIRRRAHAPRGLDPRRGRSPARADRPQDPAEQQDGRAAVASGGPDRRRRRLRLGDAGGRRRSRGRRHANGPDCTALQRQRWERDGHRGRRRVALARTGSGRRTNRAAARTRVAPHRDAAGAGRDNQLAGFRRRRGLGRERR